jgi:hypothetical protein
MKTDKKGTSQCQPGQEQHETVRDNGSRIDYVQYDYRHEDGELFTTVAPNLFTARSRRDQWLKKKNKKPIASDECKEIMKSANEQIKQLTIDRDAFYNVLKKVNGYAILRGDRLKTEIEQIILDYENRSQSTATG